MCRYPVFLKPRLHPAPAVPPCCPAGAGHLLIAGSRSQKFCAWLSFFPEVVHSLYPYFFFLLSITACDVIFSSFILWSGEDNVRFIIFNKTPRAGFINHHH